LQPSGSHKLLRFNREGSRMSGVIATAEGKVVILTGPPGAGKTTIAGMLAEGSKNPAVHLHSDDFWHYIKQGRIAPYLAEAHAQNCVVVNALVGAAHSYAAGGYLVVVDGIVGPWFLGAFRERLAGVAVHYIVLRPDLAATLQRAQARGGMALTDAEPITDLHRQFADLSSLEKHAMDTTGQSASETLALVRSAIASEEFALSEAAIPAQPFSQFGMPSLKRPH
jgi:chloramphenicol 3-O-phosphotransferase